MSLQQLRKDAFRKLAKLCSKVFLNFDFFQYNVILMVPTTTLLYIFVPLDYAGKFLQVRYSGTGIHQFLVVS
jgi:hypothetical protein